MLLNLSAIVEDCLRQEEPSFCSAPAPAPVKAVELSCVTCGVPILTPKLFPSHSLATFIGHISEYLSQAAAASYNQVSSDFDLNLVTNHIRPPGFSSRSETSKLILLTNFNRDNFNQTGRDNFYKTEVEIFIQSTISVMNQFIGPQGRDIPGNTVTNPREDLKGITTRRECCISRTSNSYYFSSESRIPRVLEPIVALLLSRAQTLNLPVSLSISLRSDNEKSPNSSSLKTLLRLNQELLSPTRVCILEGDNKLPVIMLKRWMLRKNRTRKGAKVPKRALAWKLFGQFRVSTRTFVPQDSYGRRSMRQQSKHQRRPLPSTVMEQMLVRLAGIDILFPRWFLPVFFQIPIDPEDQERLLLLAYGTGLLPSCLSADAIAPGSLRYQWIRRCVTAGGRISTFSKLATMRPPGDIDENMELSPSLHRLSPTNKGASGKYSKRGLKDLERT
ncbi:hypothetical protein Tco_0298974 [Tanacetum coccineum]